MRSWINRDDKPKATGSIPGSSHNLVLRVLTPAVFGLIGGDIDTNIQGIKTGDQSKHVRAHT